jgi:hypothetical protein
MFKVSEYKDTALPKSDLSKAESAFLTSFIYAGLLEVYRWA